MKPLPTSIDRRLANAYDNYIFDLDGTIIDSFKDIFQAISEAAVIAGAPPPAREVMRSMMHLKLDEVVARLYPSAEKERLDIISNFKRIYDASGFPGTVLYPHVTRTLAELRSEGKRIFLATNKRKAATEALLRKFHIADDFEEVITSDSGERQGLTKKEMLVALIETNRLDWTASVYIGDTRGDYLAAQQLEIGFILAAYGYGDPDLLANDEGTLTVINEISELIL